jgi:hypothetical protein
MRARVYIWLCQNQLTNRHIYLRFPVLVAANVKMEAFWDVAPCIS